MENFIYACVQVMHNAGAATAVAVPVLALHLKSRAMPCLQIECLWAVFIGWSMQIVSGLGFATTSWYFHGALPEVVSVALWALLLKIACAMIAVLSIVYAWISVMNAREKQPNVWPALFATAVLALTGAAFLRWYV